MTDNEQEQIYSIALTMVPGIGHIGAKRLVEGMKSVTDVFRFKVIICYVTLETSLGYRKPHLRNK